MQKKILDEIYKGVETMQEDFIHVKNDYQNINDRLADLETKTIRANGQYKTKALPEKNLLGKAIKQYYDYGESKNFEAFVQQKGLGLGGNTSLFEGELNVNILEQAIDNNAVLKLFGSRSTENLSYRRTVLTQRPETRLTAENIDFTPIDETNATLYASVSGVFTKMYAYPWVTAELLEQTDADVQSNILKLLAEEFELTMQAELLHGDGSGSGTKADPQHLRGVCNAAIDRANSYAEALKPALERNRSTFAAVQSGFATGIGTTAAEVEANLYKLMLTVPERSQANAKFVMHQDTLSFLMQTLKDNENRSLIDLELIEENGVWVRRMTLFGAQIVLNETMDTLGTADNAVIMYGDFKAGLEVLKPNEGEHFIIDFWSLPDTVKFYRDMYFGETVADHEAIAVLVCQA